MKESSKRNLKGAKLATAVGDAYRDGYVDGLKEQAKQIEEAEILIRWIFSTPHDERIDFIGFVDLGGGIKPYKVPYAIQCSFFYTKPKNEIFSQAIELIIKNCRDKNYGVSPICPTGPGVLGSS